MNMESEAPHGFKNPLGALSELMRFGPQFLSAKQFAVLLFVAERTSLVGQGAAISLAEFTFGIQSNGGGLLRAGSGLSRAANAKAASELEGLGILKRERDPRNAVHRSPDGKATGPNETRYSVEWEKLRQYFDDQLQQRGQRRGAGDQEEQEANEAVDDCTSPRDDDFLPADEMPDFENTPEAPGEAVAIAAHFPTNPSTKDVAESARTVRSYFPSAHDKCIEELAATARRIEPQISDQEIARILKETYKPGYQRTPKLWLDTVPEYLVVRIDAELDQLVKIPSDKMTDEQEERYVDLATRFEDRASGALERLVGQLIKIPFAKITNETCDIFWDLAINLRIPWMPGVCEAYHRFDLVSTKMEHHLADEEFTKFCEELAFLTYRELLEFQARNHLTKCEFDRLCKLASAECQSCGGAVPDSIHSTFHQKCSPSGYFCAAHCPACRHEAERAYRRDTERIFGTRLWKEVVLGRAGREMLGPDLWRQLEERDPELFALNNRNKSATDEERSTGAEAGVETQR